MLIIGAGTFRQLSALIVDISAAIGAEKIPGNNAGPFHHEGLFSDPTVAPSAASQGAYQTSGSRIDYRANDNSPGTVYVLAGRKERSGAEGQSPGGTVQPSDQLIDSAAFTARKPRQPHASTLTSRTPFLSAYILRVSLRRCWHETERAIPFSGWFRGCPSSAGASPCR